MTEQKMRTEWGVRWVDGHVEPSPNEGDARLRQAAKPFFSRVVRRTVTVGPWEAAE